MGKVILNIVLFLFISEMAFSQDTLLMMNGDYKYGKVEVINNEFVKLHVVKNERVKSRLLDREDVFSVTYKAGIEDVLYAPDSLDQFAFSQLQMKSYIGGIQDARNNFRSPLTSVGGFMIGITGGIYGFWGSILPTSYVFISGVKTPKLNKDFVSDSKIDYIALDFNEGSINGLRDKPGIENDSLIQNIVYTIDFQNYYNLGYEEKAKDKKIKNAMKGTIVGFITTIVVSLILTN